MTILQDTISESLPDLSISSSSPNDNTISTEQLTPSILCGGFELNLADESPHTTAASPYASHSTNTLPDLAVSGTVPPSTYLQSHTTSTATPLNDSMNLPLPYFKSHRLGDGLPLQQRALPSPFVQYPPTSSNSFGDTIADAWAAPSGSVSTPSHTAQGYSVNEILSENVRDDREHVQRMADSCKEDAKGVLILVSLQRPVCVCLSLLICSKVRRIIRNRRGVPHRKLQNVATRQS
jgi:hypothetical protein